MAGLFFDQIGDISQRIREIARCQRITRQRTAGASQEPHRTCLHADTRPGSSGGVHTWPRAAWERRKVATACCN